MSTDNLSASAYPTTHWASGSIVNINTPLKFYCIVYELNGEGCVAFTADAKGLYGKGDTIEDALNSLKTVIKTRIENGRGGIYAQPSDWYYQHTSFIYLENEWKRDRIIILCKSGHILVL